MHLKGLGSLKRDGQHCHHRNRRPLKNEPNEAPMEFGFGYLRISILVQGRSNVERREHGSDEEVHRPESELFARTDPRDHKYDYDYSPFVGA